MAREDGSQAGRPAIDPVGFAGLVEMIGPDMPEVVVDIVDTYREESTELLEVVASAAATQDEAVMLRPVHSLKSSSASVGALVLAGMCADLEQYLRGIGSRRDIAKELAAIQAEFQRVDAELGVLRDELAGAGV